MYRASSDLTPSLRTKPGPVRSKLRVGFDLVFHASDCSILIGDRSMGFEIPNLAGCSKSKKIKSGLVAVGYSAVFESLLHG